MDSLEIRGGVPLKGTVRISGAKNAVLPIMAATLLTREECVIRRVPSLADVTMMADILKSLGAEVRHSPGVLRVSAGCVGDTADYNLVRKMRGSICVLGPLLGRLGRAKVSMPGGCLIGMRPVDPLQKKDHWERQH